VSNVSSSRLASSCVGRSTVDSSVRSEWSISSDTVSFLITVSGIIWSIWGLFAIDSCIVSSASGTGTLTPSGMVGRSPFRIWSNGSVFPSLATETVYLDPPEWAKFSPPLFSEMSVITPNRWHKKTSPSFIPTLVVLSVTVVSLSLTISLTSEAAFPFLCAFSPSMNPWRNDNTISSGACRMHSGMPISSVCVWSTSCSGSLCSFAVSPDTIVSNTGGNTTSYPRSVELTVGFMLNTLSLAATIRSACFFAAVWIALVSASVDIDRWAMNCPRSHPNESSTSIYRSTASVDSPTLSVSFCFDSSPPTAVGLSVVISSVELERWDDTLWVTTGLSLFLGSLITLFDARFNSSDLVCSPGHRS